MKQRVVSMLRRMGAETAVDRLRFQYVRARNAARNRAFLGDNPGFAPPPATLLYEISSSVNYASYARGGRLWAERFVNEVRTFLPGSGLSICEWGCGVGRVVRHLPEIGPDIFARIHGMDYDPRMVKWCGEAFPGIEFRTNGLMPPTDFPDDALDVVYCFSVFTHLSEEAHHAWVREMRRIVRPGGLFLFTTMSDACRVNLLPAERRAYDDGGLVVRTSTREGGRTYAAFQSPAFVRERLAAGLEVLNHQPPAPYRVAQDLWTVRA